VLTTCEAALASGAAGRHEPPVDAAALDHLRHGYAAVADADLSLLRSLVGGVLAEAASGLPPQVVSMCSNIVESYAGAAPVLVLLRQCNDFRSL
jgi:hypothetical protein